MKAGLTFSGTIAAGAVAIVFIYKNGAAYKYNFANSVTGFGGPFVAVGDIANGADVYTVYGYIDVTSGTGTVLGAVETTFFQGSWLSP